VPANLDSKLKIQVGIFDDDPIQAIREVHCETVVFISVPGKTPLRLAMFGDLLIAVVSHNSRHFARR
jgi:hypothetical protein